MVFVTLETTEVQLVLVKLQEDRILIGVIDVALVIHGVYGYIFSGSVGMGELVCLDTHGSLVGIGVADLQLGCGAVGKVELRHILEIVHFARIFIFQ